MDRDDFIKPIAVAGSLRTVVKILSKKGFFPPMPCCLFSDIHTFGLLKFMLLQSLQNPIK